MNTIDKIQQVNESRKDNILKAFQPEIEKAQRANHKYIRKEGNRYIYEEKKDKNLHGGGVYSDTRGQESPGGVYSSKEEKKDFAVNKVLKLYPESTNHVIGEGYKEGEGWRKRFGVNLPKLSQGNLLELNKMGVTKVTIHLKNEYGKEVKTDYSVKELLKINKTAEIKYENAKYQIYDKNGEKFGKPFDSKTEAQLNLGLMHKDYKE